MTDAIIEANLFELYSNVASAGGFTLGSFQEFQCIHQPGMVWPDMVFYPGQQPIEALHIDQLTHHLPAQPWSKVLILSNRMLSPEVQRGLRGNGFAPVAQWTNMSIDLEQGGASAARQEHPAHTEVVQVSTEQELNDWLAIVEAELFNGQRLKQEVFRTGAANGTIHLFLAYHHGQPAATAMLFKGTTAGLYMVATAGKYRRLGLGRSIMDRVYTVALKQQYEGIVLHSTREGLPFYSSLGFQPYGTMILFYKKNLIHYDR